MNDRDLPNERETFDPAPTVTIVMTTAGPALAHLIPKSIEEQQAIHHNHLRYAELGKLRRGQANLYNETRYR